MADANGPGRRCPACGRRVPRHVEVCRCGANLPADAESPPARAAEDTPSSFAAGVRATLAAVAALGVAAFMAYRFTSPVAPPAAAPASEGAPVPSAASPAPAPQPVWPSLDIPVTPAAAPEPAPPVPAPPPPATPPADAGLEDTVSRVMPAVVLIKASTGTGSGFFVQPDTLLTNAHVVGADRAVTVRRTSGPPLTARVERVWRAVDLAVLKLPAPPPDQSTIRLGSAAGVRVGQEVFTIGSALGALQNTVTRGIVSALRESGAATLVQTDAAANPGNSGGPLLDRSGVAVGITTMGYREFQGLNFAVAAEHGHAILAGGPEPTGPAPGAPNSVRARNEGAVSESDRRRSEGERLYEQALAELARAADSLDGEWKRYRQQCYSGRVVGVFDREWFALATDRAMPDQVNPQCAAYHGDFVRGAGEFRDRLLAVGEEARRAGVYPGTLRDARRRYRVENGVWTR